MVAMRALLNLKDERFYRSNYFLSDFLFKNMFPPGPAGPPCLSRSERRSMRTPAASERSPLSTVRRATRTPPLLTAARRRRSDTFPPRRQLGKIYNTAAIFMWFK